MKLVLDCQGVFVHVVVTVEGIEHEQINLLNICETEDSKRVRWSLDSMSQEQLLEDLEAVVLRVAILDQLLDHVVHDLEEAGHLLLTELLTVGKVTVQVSELLDYSHLSSLAHRTLRRSAIQLISNPSMGQPRLTDRLALSI